MEGLRGERDYHVDREQQEGAHHRRAARRLGRVLGLLVDRDGRVPAPVDEDRQQQAAAHRPERLDVERVEPAQRRVHAAGRMPGPDLDERDDGEEHEDHDLGAEQPPLRAGRGLDPDITDRAHQQDPDHAGDADPQLAVRQAGRAEQLEGVAAGDLGQACHHEHVREDQSPPAEPAGDRPERPRAPGKRRPAVRVGLVQILETERDKQHRHKREHHDDRRLEPDPDHRRDRTKRRRQTVGRRRRGDTDHHTRHEPQRTRLQALVERIRMIDRSGYMPSSPDNLRSTVRVYGDQ